MVANKSDVALTALIILLVGINIVLLLNGIYLDCGECVIKFTNNRISGVAASFPTIEVTASDLREAWLKGECPVKWERTRGFYKNG